RRAHTNPVRVEHELVDLVEEPNGVKVDSTHVKNAVGNASRRDVIVRVTSLLSRRTTVVHGELDLAVVVGNRASRESIHVQLLDPVVQLAPTQGAVAGDLALPVLEGGTDREGKAALSHGI